MAGIGHHFLTQHNRAQVQAHELLHLAHFLSEVGVEEQDDE